MADALELKMDETLPGPAVVEAVDKPAVATVPESSAEPALPVGLLVLLLVGFAIYLGWRSGILKYYRAIMMRLTVRKRVARLAGRQPLRGQIKRSTRMEQRRNPLPVGSQAPVKTMDDLTNAKKLLMEDAYDQAELFAMSAIRSEPYNLDAYVVALKILSKYQTPQLTRLVRGGLQLLRRKNPYLWREVAEQGRKLAPEIEDWDDDPVMKPDS